MAAPVIATVSSNKTGNPLTEIAFTFATDGPSGIATGDLLVLLVGVAGGSLSASFGTIANWDKREESILGAGSLRPAAAIYTHEVGAIPPTGVTTITGPEVTNTGLAAKVLRITGRDPVSWLDTSDAGAGDGSTAVGDPYVIPQLTTTADECLTIWLAAAASALLRTNTWSGGASEQGDFGSDPGTALALTWATLVKTPAGATGNQSVEPSGACSGAGCSIAIAPAAAVVTARDADRRLVMGVG